MYIRACEEPARSNMEECKGLPGGGRRCLHANVGEKRLKRGAPAPDGSHRSRGTAINRFDHADPDCPGLQIETWSVPAVPRRQGTC